MLYILGRGGLVYDIVFDGGQGATDITLPIYTI